jgi:prepilin-type N-terminal cleavage/methylation domain-containing protein
VGGVGYERETQDKEEKAMKRDRGFTIVELMVVVAVIGLLLSIVIPHFIGVTQKSRAGAAVENLKSVQSAIGMYFADNDGTCYPTTVMITDYESLRKFAGNYGLTLPKGHSALRWQRFIGYTSDECDWYLLVVELYEMQFQASNEGICCSGPGCYRLARNVAECEG